MQRSSPVGTLVASSTTRCARSGEDDRSLDYATPSLNLVAIWYIDFTSYISTVSQDGKSAKGSGEISSQSDRENSPAFVTENLPRVAC